MRGAAGTMLASATLLTLSPSLFAAPQSGTTAVTTVPDGTAYWAVVTGSAVNVRSGPSAQSAYAFGKLKQGDLVRVLKEEYGWARVQTEGNAFGDVFAFVPADRRVTLSADGTTATVSARTEVRAPNVEAGSSPDKSWKQIGSAEAGTTLSVLGTATGEKESVYKVKVPATSEAWINMQFIRKANAAESATAMTATAPAPAAVAVTTPVATAATTETTATTVTSGVAVPVNAPDAGAPAPTPIAADFGSSPIIPPLLGQQPVNASVETPAAETVTVETVTTTTRTTKPKFVSRRTTLDDLETQFKAVRSQPEASAEFEALLPKYDELATANDAARGVQGVAGARAKQLSLLIETQRGSQEIRRIDAKRNTNKQDIAELVMNIQRRSDFTAIGVLNASAVYDGERLPEMYRVCDPITGATIAYVEPNADIAMAPMIGTLVGVKGGKQYDPALRITVITPLSIDLLTQRDTPQVTKSESTRPIAEAGKFVPANVAVTAPASSPVTAPEAAPCPEGFAPAPGATP